MGEGRYVETDIPGRANKVVLIHNTYISFDSRVHTLFTVDELLNKEEFE